MADEALTGLEKAVLSEICKQLPALDRAALEEQIQGISVSKRENTGAGFFTYFVVAPTAVQRIRSSTTGCYVAATINGLEHALAFILFLNDGRVDYLEGYTESLRSTAGMDLAALDFDLVSAPPFSD